MLPNFAKVRKKTVTKEIHEIDWTGFNTSKLRNIRGEKKFAIEIVLQFCL